MASRGPPNSCKYGVAVPETPFGGKKTFSRSRTQIADFSLQALVPFNAASALKVSSKGRRS